MRKFLFRGKTVGANSKFVYGNLIYVEGYCCILERKEDLHPMDEPYLDGEIGWIDGKATPVRPETVGQFTGLHDKNGRKIFEGDVLKGHNSLHEDRLIHRVVYETNGFYYMDEDDVTWHPDNINNVEIIGNIHDNPELMEEE